MKLAISNLSWNSACDDIMYSYLREHKIALEAAPVRIFKWKESEISDRMVSPYERIGDASDWYRLVNSYYSIDVISMHSVLYGVREDIFSSGTYRRFLADYLRKAVDFSVILRCPNLVFSCAENRVIPRGMNRKTADRIALSFFRSLSDYAAERGVCISLEPVPAACGTDFINTTGEAIDFAAEVGKQNFKVNVSLGTVIYNNEDMNDIFTRDNMNIINHVHVSEPGLGPLKSLKVFEEAAMLLRKNNYRKYVSVEMLRFPDIKLIQGAMNYFMTIFR
ncbi:MAG: TIM barrel protein [Parasporobacterium sp.]|nr:TIM barrel protein [Parasporobacterium sp.]